jgi:hypothetical protein
MNPYSVVEDIQIKKKDYSFIPVEHLSIYNF